MLNIATSRAARLWGWKMAFALMMMMMMLVVAGPVAAQIQINGVSHNQVVQEELNLSASVAGNVSALTLQLIGPDDLNITTRTDRSWAYLQTVPGQPWEAMPWDSQIHPQGNYTFIVYATVRSRTGERLKTASVNFTVKHPEPVVEITPPVAVPPVQTPAEDVVAQAQEQEQVQEQAQEQTQQEQESPSAQEPVAQPVETAVVSPAPEVPASPAAEPLAFRWANGSLVERTIGETQTVDLVVTGDMPNGGDFLVIAWDHDRKRVVDGFVHVMTQSPWRIAAAQLDELPVGSVELQVHHRVDSKIKSTIKHTLLNQAKPAATVDQLPYVAFSSGAASSYTRGSGKSMALSLDGPMPDGGDVLMIAWSIEGSALVGAFAHELTGEPWSIDASRLDTLPLGLNEIQLLTRLNGAVQTKLVKTVTVLAAPAPLPEPEPVDPVADNPPATDGDTDSPATDPVMETPEGDGGSTAGSVAVEVHFAAETPTQYVQGSGQVIELDVSGDLPAGGDVLMLSWSVSQGQMVDAFAHELTGRPFKVSNSKLDQLPTGAAELQALVRLPGQPLVIRKFPITVVGEGQTPVDEPVADEPTTTTDYTGLEISADGFTVFNESSDTQKIYVAANGNDNNNGLSPSTPVKSPRRGYELLRNDKPDWLLFKAGDTFSGNIGDWSKSGRSKTEKMMVGTYGTGDRPLMVTEGGNFISNQFGADVKHVAFTGLEIYAASRDPNRAGFEPNEDKRANPEVLKQYGLYFLGDDEDILVEDCKFRLFMFNIVFQSGENSGYAKDIQIRRNIIVDSYGHWSGQYGGHSSGVFLAWVDGALIEECVFDHNGWNERVSGASRTKFNHGMYIQKTSKNLVVRNCVVARSSAHGLQLRGGGDVQDSLFVANALGFYVARNKSVVNKNVVLQSDDMSSKDLRGAGISTLPCLEATITNNIISQKVGTAAHASAIAITWAEEASAWVGGQGYRIRLADNKIHQWSSNRGAINIDTGSAQVLQNERNAADKASGGEGNPPWIDPDRDVASYMQSIGKQASLEAFIDAARNRPRGQWVEAYTSHGVNTYIREGFNVPLYD